MRCSSLLLWWQGGEVKVLPKCELQHMRKKVNVELCASLNLSHSLLNNHVWGMAKWRFQCTWDKVPDPQVQEVSLAGEEAAHICLLGARGGCVKRTTAIDLEQRGWEGYGITDRDRTAFRDEAMRKAIESQRWPKSCQLLPLVHGPGTGYKGETSSAMFCVILN